MPSLLIDGMHGLGDNINQRAIVRRFLENCEVWLKTPWPCVYDDLVHRGLHFVRKRSSLHAQKQNEVREAYLFEPEPTGLRTVTVSYRDVRTTVLEAMFRSVGLTLGPTDSNSIPIVRSRLTKPVLVYRPLTVRREWPPSRRRNADTKVYADALRAIRAPFLVVSVAALHAGETLLADQPTVDATMHDGLSFATLTELFANASLVYTSAGFGAVLGPAVGTPTISIVGTEPARWLEPRDTPYLGIEPPYRDINKRVVEWIAGLPSRA